MNLERAVGRLFFCGWGTAEVDDHARALLEEIGAGGVILFTRNLESPEQIAALTTELRARSAVPLLVGIDQEGGRVSRIATPGMVFVPNEALGRHDRPDLTCVAAEAIAEQLAALGINVDFAPVADVNSNPDNPVIGDRSYGADATLVARHVPTAVAGFLTGGTLPVVKHFPGHGDTSADSHYELPVQPAPRERLDSLELVPFRAAIDAGAPAIMSSHILFPALDPELPATLSRPIMHGLLREELGFQGLVVTDCMEMQGIAAHWEPEEAAVLALAAGADMLLVCHTLETQRRMHQAVCRAVRDGRIPEVRIRRSVERIQHAYDRAPARTPDPGEVGSQRFRELEDRVRAATCGG